ncbi:hemicentin-1-like [Ylistrum balloti]|uniref:hemicentin-1-like n=1 Tax=Ylistrum balloti TaxID=509963 RepID=UPI0029058A0B|nr:hemicentin-1-like [Ylistrum balloti]
MGGVSPVLLLAAIFLPGVLAQVPTVTIAQTSFGAQVSTTITLGCTVSSVTTVTNVFWQRDVGSGTQTITVDGVNFSGSSVSTPSLTIIDAVTSDSGSYTCFAVNSAGTGNSETASVTVSTSVPSVTIGQTAYSTNTGNSITLLCTVSSTTTVTNVFWQRIISGVTSTITIDNVNFSGASVGTPSLTVLNADSSDSGLYICFATNSAGTGQSAQTQLTVSGAVPTVTISQTAYSTSTGNSITLGCTVSANPAHTSVFWQRNVGSGTQSITIDGINYSGSSVNSPSLTVINADTSDTGTYTCFASNSVGTGQSAATTLTVSGNVPTVTISQTAYSTSTGNSITLGCTVSANPAHTSVFWQRNVGSGTQSITIDGINYSGSSVNSPSLTVINADTTDTGTYTCFASNSVGTGQSASTTLTVSGNVPTVTISQTAYSTSTGNSITLGCTVSANPAHTSVFWQRNVGSGTQSITIDGVNYSGSSVNSPSLTVINADTSDTGTYTCFATNSVGTGQSAATTLTVSGNVPTVTISQTAYSTSTGNSITLGCTVSANPAHTSVFWQRNVGSGTQSITIDGINYSGSSVNSPSLTVINADATDTGTYTCFATNSVGTGQSAATTLTVTGTVPTVTISQTAYSTSTGNSITLGCTVSANPAHTSVFWQRNVGSGTQSITIDGINYSGSSVNSPSLTVINADTSDTGTYTCFATNSVGTGQSAATTLTVTGNVPTVTISQTAYSTSTGNSITLGCTVSANPAHTSVFWQRNVGSGTQSITIDGINYSGSSVNSPSLTVINADTSDTGTYTCFASNSAGTGQSASTTLTVTGNVPTVTISQTAYSTNTGNSITLGCTVSANPAHTTVFWQRNVGSGTQSITIDGVNYSGSSVNSPSLTVINADTSDTGTYTCFATNSVGTGQSAATTLTVTGNVPTVTISQTAYSTNTGNSITLGCTVSANPAHTTVFWQRNVGSGTQSITIDGVNYSGSSVNSPSLTVINADTSDSGTYTCFATNSVGTGQSAATTLTVTGTIPVVTISQNAYSIATGNSITLGCTVSANPAHTTVFWQRNVGSGTQSITIDGVNYSGSSVNSPSLTVINADTSDTGTYTCFATNSVGTGQSAATTLTVTGNVPTVTITQNAYSTSTGNSITLECTVSANPAHTSVFWQRNVGSGTQSITIDGINYSGSSVNSPSLTVINADTSDTGTYTCFASNSVGTGQSSATTLTVTGNIPVVTISQNAYSTNTGTTITLGCTVSANPAHTTVFWQRNVGSGTESITVDGVNYSGSSVNSPSLTVLNADTTDTGTYTCFATNSVGTGQSAATTLTVTGNIPVVTISQNAYSTNTGTTITLGCTVSANPAHTTVFWQRNVGSGTESITIDGVNYSGSSVNSPSLTVINADTSDTGTYTCFATNSIGTGQSSSTTLTVTGNIPVVTISQNAYNTNTGTTITLGCTVSANPAHTTVFWQRNVGSGTESITIDGVNYSGSSVNSPSLTVINADTSDTGTYTCFATNSVGTGQSSATTLTVTGNVPVVTISQNAYNTNTGTTITLGCTVSANPAHTTVFWQRNVGSGTESITIDGVNYSGSSVNSPSLTVINADINDSGTYTCFATNSVGTGQSSATTLTVSGNIPVVTISQNAYSTNTGTTITLGCTVSANPAHTTVFWQRNVGSGTESITIDGVNYSGSSVNSPSLTVINADTTDTGTYTCFATNSVGTGQSSSTTLTVTGNIPTVTITQNAYSITTGNSITLECTVSANPAHTTVFWQRNVGSGTQSITIDGVNYSGSSVNSPSLTVINADTTDTGTYTCFATNSVGTGQSSATTLTVTGTIPVVTITLNAYSTNTGTSITLGCTVSANPAHTSVFWQRNVGSGTESITIDGVNYSGSSVNSPSLTVINADISDSGTYTCFATNSIGTGQSAATTLTVTGNIPVVTISQNAYNTNTGTSITLGCTVSANPAHNTVFWRRNVGSGTQDISIDGVNFSGSTVNSPSLTVINANIADSGSYICFASNSVGTGQSTATTLTVSGNVPVVTVDQASYTVSTGQAVTLGCSVSAVPTHTSVTWQRFVNGVSTTINIDGVKYAGSTVNSPSLTIFNAAASDQTVYTCSATNIVGTGTSSQTSLNVVGSLPVVTVAQTSYTVTTGGTITLVCTVSATPAATTVSWRRLIGGVSTAINVGGNKYSGVSLSDPSLTISNSQSSDEGFYICQATNVVGTGESSTTYLTVSGSIPVVTIPQNTYNVLTGGSVVIDCAISAIPTHTSVTWNRVSSGGVTSVIQIDGVNYSGGTVNSPSLSVNNADNSDIGFYVCTATNSIGTGTSNQAYLSVTGAPPTATVAQTSYSIVTGASITLQCSVFGTPAVTSVSWTRTYTNGVSSTISVAGQKYSGSTVSNPSLTIFNADSNDQASYICTATNSLGSGQSQAVSLSVTGNPPTVTVSQTQYTVITGASVTLQCSVTAIPAATNVFWERTVNGVTSQLAIDQVQYGGSSINSPSLIVYNANSADSGVYVCKATNSVGTGQSQGVTISVTGSVPVVNIQQATYTVNTGSSVTLECTVSATPQANSVTWRRNINGVSSIISINGGKYNGGSVTSPSLVIYTTSSSDIGYYTCEATNAVGTGTSTDTYLDVVGSLLTVQVPQSFYTVQRGQSVTLECIVSGTPAVTSVTWRRTSGGITDNVIIDNSKYQGSNINSPSLIINNADSVDTGTYVCTATNSIGTATSSQTTLSVTGEIPTVTIPVSSYDVVTGSSITITCSVSANPPHTSVSWTRANNINSSPVSIVIDGTTYSGGSVNSPSLTINSASASDQGYYVCRATNSIGTGTSGQSYLTVTGALPSVTIPSNAYSVITGGSIQIPCTVVASPSASSVTWTKSSGTNTAISIITIDNTKYQGGNPSVPTLTITNANSNDQAYYRCSAANSVGTAESIITFLTVSGNIPTVTIGQAQYNTLLGTSVTIDCTVSANPQATSVAWERVIGGVTTTITIDGTKFVGSSVNNPSLTITDASTDDMGYYVCTAVNSVGVGRSSQGYLTVDGLVPAVVISRPSYSFVVGETAVIDCDYSSSPDATSVYWNKIVDTQTTRISTLNTNKYSGSTLANPSLTITSTDSSDQAFYRCVVVNSVGEGRSNQAYLYITGNIPSVTVPQSSYSVSLDDTATITCTVSAIPSATSVTWEYINANGVVSNVNVADSRISGGIVSNPSLVISGATLSDQGTYRCKATNAVGTGQSQQVYLYVTGTTPSVRVTVSAYTVDVDTSATLACIVDASPAATSVYWTKIVDGVSSTISTSSNKYDGSTPGSPSLIINNLDMSDEGSYRCNAVNTVGTGQSGLTSLIVAYAPRNTVVNPTSLTTREGQSATSECITDANPAATFQWVKDNTNQVVSVGKMLSIENIDRGHDSTYTCTATNSQGSQTARFNLDVQYKPISTVTAAQAAVVLSLNAQRDLECNTVANPAVQSYRWQKDGNSIADANSLVYRVIATDSNSYGVYTCYATNTIGESSAITYTVSSGDVTTTVQPSVEAISTGLIIAIVISALVLILIVIIIVCCCVTRGVCREEALERQRVIVEKPRQMQFINPAPMILPRQEMIAVDDGFYRAPTPQYQFTPQLAYYETEGSRSSFKRDV